MSKLKPVHMVYVSSAVAEDAKRLLFINENKSRVIHNGVPDLTLISQSMVSDRFEVIFPARVCSAKNHTCVARAMPLLDENIYVSLYGSGTNDPDFQGIVSKLAGAASKRLSFHG